MTYMGSKRRLAKYILPFILKDRKENQYYVEPFCGGCNLIDKVDGNRIGNDMNYYLIEMWKALQNGWIPPMDIDEEMYNYYKNKYKHNSYTIDDVKFIGYIGFNLSFGGRWWSSYARNKKNSNYGRYAYNNIITNQLKNIIGIEFYNVDYKDLIIPDDSIVYCDPPYKNTANYKNDINHDEFYDYCRKLKNDGHQVFISEYNMPDDFIILFEKEQTTTLHTHTYKKAIEKLFTL